MILSGNYSELSTDRAYLPSPTVTILNDFTQQCKTVRQHQNVVVGRNMNSCKEFSPNYSIKTRQQIA